MTRKKRCLFQASFMTAALVLMAFAIPASADHPQETAAGTVTFDHRGGNEWWVEAVVTHEGSRPDEVHAWDAGDDVWRPLEWKDWGEWAASFHIEPGTRVVFRSIDHTLGTADSCWFTHPDGAEECEGGGQGRNDPTFDASFSTPGGNEWWVEVYVEANDFVAGVEARDGGGEWITLTKRHWGAWAASFHVEDGSLVDFRATSTDGGTDVSGKYRWPDGTQVTPEPDDDTGTGTDVITQGAFGPKASNEWWIETMVVADGNLSGVEARADGGSWHALTLRDWGAWAASFHAPSGSIVEFRADGKDGGTIMSDGFVWPQADPANGDTDWPHDGAYVQMSFEHTIGGNMESELDVVYVFDDDVGWYHQCDGYENRDDPVFEFGRRAPPTGTKAGIGDTVSVWVLERCDPRSVDGITVTERHDRSLHQDGDPVTVEVLHGERIPDCRCNNDHVEWDGGRPWLTYLFHNGGTETRASGVIDTNAPIR